MEAFEMMPFGVLEAEWLRRPGRSFFPRRPRQPLPALRRWRTILPDEWDEGRDALDDAADDEGELPKTIEEAVRSLKLVTQLNYQRIGTLSEALKDARATGEGLYVIEFWTGRRWRGYSGHTDNLHRRLTEHNSAARRLGLNVRRHVVYISRPAWKKDERKRRSVEASIHAYMLEKKRGVLTNPVRELELGELVVHRVGCGCRQCQEAGASFEVLAFGP
ncbi:hypothetical protein [Massilia sp. YIM B04103]|uniref:hypothetical protein n=1 Tax=Massilia sp. YIM B04103 TaxID=2963106 RepID=UPI00210A4B9B|nr:hypothetical protein [Massilia sp. YIM B04103]